MEAHPTCLEIDLGALGSNYRFLRSRLLPQTKFVAVVKANAYGSESAAIALYLEKAGVDYFAVAYASEGIALRKAGINTPIMVFHTLANSFKEIVDYNLEPTLYSETLLEGFLDFTKRHDLKNYPVHLKFNTGLNRLGFDVDECKSVFLKAMAYKNLSVASVYSHLAASEDLQERAYTLVQIEQFKQVVSIGRSLLTAPFLAHILNTSGILNYPEAQFDMVRSGIGLYGFGNSADYNADFTPISTLKTVISQIHHLKQNDFLGYGKSHKALKDSTTATLPIGHADGINRIYGKGKGYVFVNGKKAPIIGNTCMDMIMIDVSEIDCKAGDEAILFGKAHNAEDLAASAGTISYELITGISQRVVRKFL